MTRARSIPALQTLVASIALTTAAAASSGRPGTAGASVPDAPPASAAVATSQATHTLFMGVELGVQQGEQVLPVRDVQGSSLVVKIKGQETAIATRGKPFNMKVTRALKVTTRSATLGGFNVERGYSRANDPFKKFVAAAGAAGGADAVASIAQGQYTAALLSRDYAAIAESTGGMASADDFTAPDGKLSSLADATYMAQSQTISAGVAASELSGDLSAEAYDALVISFDISSPQPMDNAYVVVLAELRAGEAAKAVRHNWVYAKSLGAIGEKARPVYIKQTGFPFGFVIEKCEVHLFNAGEEVATNVAPMRTELSKDDAFEYAAVDYVSRHKEETLPAGIATDQNTEALRQHLARTYEGGPIYVEVARTGRVGRIFRDKNAAEPLNDAELEGILRDLRFNPALSKGRAVDSVVKVKASADRA